MIKENTEKTKTKTKNNIRTEYKNSEVNRFLRNFYDISFNDKTTGTGSENRVLLARLVATQDTNGPILYAGDFETDEDGYIKSYNLLIAARRYIGIMIMDDVWVCTTRKLTDADMALLSDIDAAANVAAANRFMARRQEEEEARKRDVDDRQLGLFC